MVCREKRNPVERRHFPADAGDRGIRFKKGIVGMPPERADNPGTDDLYLAEKIIPAARRFVRFGVTVARGAAFQDVAYVNVASLQADPLNERIEQFACPADKRPALIIFFFPRRFTDKHDVSPGVAFAKDDRLTRPGKVAPGARHSCRFEAVEGGPILLSAYILIDPHIFQCGHQAFCLYDIH